MSAVYARRVQNDIGPRAYKKLTAADKQRHICLRRAFTRRRRYLNLRIDSRKVVHVNEDEHNYFVFFPLLPSVYTPRVVIAEIF